MQTLLTNKNQSNKREHRAKCRTSNLQKMKTKKKIITLIGLALFVGGIVFNMHMVHSNDQVNDVVLENIDALASGSVSAGCLCMYQPDEELCWEDECPECGIGVIVCE